VVVVYYEIMLGLHLGLDRVKGVTHDGISRAEHESAHHRKDGLLVPGRALVIVCHINIFNKGEFTLI